MQWLIPILAAQSERDFFSKWSAPIFLAVGLGFAAVVFSWFKYKRRRDFGTLANQLGLILEEPIEPTVPPALMELVARDEFEVCRYFVHGEVRGLVLLICDVQRVLQTSPALGSVLNWRLALETADPPYTVIVLKSEQVLLPYTIITPRSRVKEFVDKDRGVEIPDDPEFMKHHHISGRDREAILKALSPRVRDVLRHSRGVSVTCRARTIRISRFPKKLDMLEIKRMLDLGRQLVRAWSEEADD